MHSLLILLLWSGVVVPATHLDQRGSQQHLNRVKGRVLDMAKGQPIPFVRMEVIGSPEGMAVSDFDGEYLIFPNVPPGLYAIYLRAENYVPRTDSVDVIDGRISFKDFFMIPFPR